MTKLWLPLALLMVAGATLPGCANFEATAESAHHSCEALKASGLVVDRIRTFEQAGAASNVSGMTLEAAQSMFAPEYVAVGQDGSIKSRNDALQMFESRRSAGWAEKFEIIELDIKVYCDMATVVGFSEALWKGAPPTAKPLHFRWLNVWKRANKDWQLIASQFTEF